MMLFALVASLEGHGGRSLGRRNKLGHLRYIEETSLPRALLPLFALLAVGLCAPASAAAGAADGGPIRASESIRPGHEAFLEATLRENRLVCLNREPGCRFSLRIDRNVMRLDDGFGPLIVAHGATAPAPSCLAAPAEIWLCPPDGAPEDLLAHAGMLHARLTANRVAAEALASVWGAGDALEPGPVGRLSRLLDWLVLFWLLLLGVVATGVARSLPSRDRWSAAALFFCGLGLRATIAGRPVNWYLPLPPEGGLGGVFRGSYPTVFDSLVRLVELLPGPGDTWLFNLHRILGALAPAVLWLGARRLGVGRLHAVTWAALLLVSPSLVWLSVGDSSQIWPLVTAAAALLGFAAGAEPPSGLGLAAGAARHALRGAALLLVLCSLTLGAAVRAEIVPGLFAVGLLVIAARESESPRSWRVLLWTLVALSVSAALFWLPLWRPLLDQAGGAAWSFDALPRLLWVMLRHDPGLPGWAWALFFVAPAVVGGVVSVQRAVRGRPAALLPLVGLVAVAAPPVLGGFDIGELVEVRYTVLGPLFGLWFVALGVAAMVRLAGEALPGRPAPRWLWLLPVVGTLLAGQGSIRSQAEWQAEYAFLRDALATLPDGCVLTAARHAGMRPGADARELELDTGGREEGSKRLSERRPSGLPLLQIALPHPLLALRFPALLWDVRDPAALVERAFAPAKGRERVERGECRAVYLDPICHLALLEDPSFSGELGALVALYSPACRRIEDLMEAAEDEFTLLEERYEIGVVSFYREAFRDHGLRLRLMRVR